MVMFFRVVSTDFATTLGNGGESRPIRTVPAQWITAFLVNDLFAQVTFRLRRSNYLASSAGERGEAGRRRRRQREDQLCGLLSN